METLDGSAFDFWIGEWDCLFNGGTATNTVRRESEGCAIVEQFNSLSPEIWAGLSVSVYNPHVEAWRQTWIDQHGSYWHFMGALVGGNPSFATLDRDGSDKTFKRIIYSNITEESFDWRWESSPDGHTWTENWAITYTRRTPSRLT